MDRLYPATFTVPASTPIVSAVSQAFPLEDNDLIYVDLIIPQGVSGLAGIRLLWANQQVVPWGNLSWIISDDDKIHIDCDFLMTASGLVIQGYNTDIFAHTFYLRALIRDHVATIPEIVTNATSEVALPSVTSEFPQASTVDTLTANFPTVGELPAIPEQQAETIAPTTETVPVTTAEPATIPISSTPKPVAQPKPAPISPPVKVPPSPVAHPPGAKHKPLPPVKHPMPPVKTPGAKPKPKPIHAMISGRKKGEVKKIHPAVKHKMALVKHKKKVT